MPFQLAPVPLSASKMPEINTCGITQSSQDHQSPRIAVDDLTIRRVERPIEGRELVPKIQFERAASREPSGRRNLTAILGDDVVANFPTHPDTHERTNGRSIPDEVISRIEQIAADKDGTKFINHLSEDAAQFIVDVVHEAVDLPDLPSPPRRKWLSALFNVCGHRALLPRSLQIPLCYDRLKAPQYGGGCADVWKCYYQGQRVAAKVLRVYLTSDLKNIRKEFCKEAIRWNALNHPNVLPLLGVMMDESQFVMVSEWMEHGDINKFVRYHPDADLFGLLEDVARGLIYVHDQEMAHGDLKGANILIGQDRRARLADFGLLTAVSDPANPTALGSYTPGGTIPWMGPELLTWDQTCPKNNRPTKQSDCYALGMVIYEVLSGQAPFAPLYQFAVMWKIVSGERPQRPGGVEGTPFTEDLWRMLNRCWATRPESRPSSSEVLECLEQVSRDTKPTS